MRKVIFFSTFCFISSCSTTIDYQGSTNTYTSPEVAGETMGISGQLEFGNSTKFSLATLEQSNIFSSNINVDLSSGMAKDNVLSAQAALGLGKKFELYYRALADSPDLLGGKFQVLGEGAIKKADGFKLLVFGGYGPGMDDDEKFTATNGSGGSREYDSKLNVSMYEFGISLGQRFKKMYIVYLTPFYREFKADATLTSTSYPTVQINKKSIVKGCNVGVRLETDTKFFINLEAGYAHSQYSSTIQRDDYTLGGAAGITSF